MSTVFRSTVKISNTKSVRAKNAPNGETKKLTGRYVPMKKHAASVLRAVPAPTATATVEADDARLRRPEPPGMDGQAQGKKLRPHQRRLQRAENLRRQTADGMPQVRHKPQVRGLPRVRMPATKEEIAPHAPPSPAGLFIPQPLTQGVNMTIGELIKKLEHFDPEQDVCITLDGSEGAGMFDIDPQPTECACEDAKGKTFTETIIGLYPVGAAVEEAE